MEPELTTTFSKLNTCGHSGSLHASNREQTRSEPAHSESKWQNVIAGRALATKSSKVSFYRRGKRSSFRSSDLSEALQRDQWPEPRTFKPKPLDFCSLYCTMRRHWVKPHDPSVGSQKSNSFPSTAISFKNSAPFFWFCTLRSTLIYLSITNQCTHTG